MSDNHQDSTPSGSSTVRRETLSDKVPGLWTFIVLILLMVAMGVTPTLRKLRRRQRPHPQLPHPTLHPQWNKHLRQS